MNSRLVKKYRSEIAPALKEQLGDANALAVPRLVKVTLNVGINARNTENQYIELVEGTLARISGQKPVRTKARKAISAFKIRDNMVVGAKVTLRGERMYDFIDKLVNVSIPRIRDFRGLPEKVIDRQGNLSLGFKEHNVFPEIKSEEIERLHGLEVTVTTTAGTTERGLALFKALGFPFQRKTS
ncbi:MAG: 50S ribosomal protein L5 [Candidatus Buchananbacteria bacterium]|nr:50S ribosomal protein L5 [Candidatus Buchananbacteria bacterium]